MLLGVYIVGNGCARLARKLRTRVILYTCAHMRPKSRACARLARKRRMNFTLFALSSDHKFAV